MQLPENAALQQAAEWFAILRSEQAKETDYLEWKVWLDADTAHQSAWVEVESIDATFKHMAGSGNPQAAKSALLTHASASRRHALKVLSLTGVSVITGLVVKRYSPWRDWLTNVVATHSEYQVAVGQTRLLTLAEGSRLWLNTNSHAEVRYSFALRRITLHTGELLIASAKDNSGIDRPLVVDTIHGRITAIGTRFTVKLNTHATYVAVFEGAVSVQAVNSGRAQVLKAGEQLQFDAQAMQAIQPAEKAREVWTRGILLADNRRLDDFMTEVSRYRTGRIIVSPKIAHLRIMGAFPISHTDLILTSIAESFPVTINHVGGMDIQLVEK
ncbi:FecR domain-containing protein [Methylophilus aquaticus]|uniref:FecR domain-containing protein n=2 Tax=Methylophilus aquaticus TaxID=1971610 RepID=A0ABT9JXC8_9PROT|nr:FecR domain-containing protein [Methylophilus aquaticus]